MMPPQQTMLPWRDDVAIPQEMQVKTLPIVACSVYVLQFYVLRWFACKVVSELMDSCLLPAETFRWFTRLKIADLFEIIQQPYQDHCILAIGCLTLKLVALLDQVQRHAFSMYV